MKQRGSQFFTLLILLSFPFLAFSENVDDIIAKHIEAHGGIKAWNKVESLKITANFTSFSIEKEYSCYKTKSGSYYGDFHLGEQRVIESYHDNFGWTIDPWQDINYARKVNSGELNAFAQKAEFFTPFYNYKEKGHSVEYTGKEKVDGKDFYVLKLTRSNGKVETWYLDTKTYLEYMCISEWVDFAYSVPSEVYFDEFQSVNGLVIPFFVERTFLQRDRILLIEKVEINPEIDESLFEMPMKKEMEKFAFLEGDWDVNLQVWSRRQMWYDLGTTTSKFHFPSTNLLEEDMTYERNFAISRTMSFVYNDSGKNYRVAIFDDLSSNFTLFEGTWGDSSFVFDDTKIMYGDDKAENKEYTQYSIYLIEEDSFIIECKISNDKGETWKPKDMFSYTRRKE